MIRVERNSSQHARGTRYRTKEGNDVFIAKGERGAWRQVHYCANGREHLVGRIRNAKDEAGYHYIWQYAVVPTGSANGGIREVMEGECTLWQTLTLLLTAWDEWDDSLLVEVDLSQYPEGLQQNDRVEFEGAGVHIYMNINDDRSDTEGKLHFAPASSCGPGWTIPLKVAKALVPVKIERRIPRKIFRFTVLTIQEVEEPGYDAQQALEAVKARVPEGAVVQEIK